MSSKNIEFNYNIYLYERRRNYYHNYLLESITSNSLHPKSTLSYTNIIARLHCNCFQPYHASVMYLMDEAPGTIQVVLDRTEDTFSL